MPVLDARALDDDPEGMALLAGVLRPGAPAEKAGKARKRATPSRGPGSVRQNASGAAPLAQRPEGAPVLDPAG